jgi:hypothetical protein
MYHNHHYLKIQSALRLFYIIFKKVVDISLFLDYIYELMVLDTYEPKSVTIL